MGYDERHRSLVDLLGEFEANARQGHQERTTTQKVRARPSRLRDRSIDDCARHGSTLTDRAANLTGAASWRANHGSELCRQRLSRRQILKQRRDRSVNRFAIRAKVAAMVLVPVPTAMMDFDEPKPASANRRTNKHWRPKSVVQH